MSETQEIHIQVINPSDVGLRLDKFLSLKTNLSRTRISALIKDGCLKPNLPADFKVVLGQTFDLILPPAEDATPRAASARRAQHS